MNETIIEESVVHKRFACDLAQCKGACCTLPGGRGAPLQDDEIDEIERAFPFAKKYLSETHLNAIAVHGMIEGIPGSHATVCIDEKDCVFVYYEDSVAKCSLEKAYLAGETTWRKPISCHLFPIRISRNGPERVRYEQIRECLPAVSNGTAKDIPLYVFLKEALIRKFGKTWYEDFQTKCELENNAR